MINACYANVVSWLFYAASLFRATLTAVINQIPLFIEMCLPLYYKYFATKKHVWDYAVVTLTMYY